jgi:hypothetical protein
MKKDDEIINMTVGTIRRMAGLSPTMKAVLEKDFPEIFGPEYQYYKSGTIFIINDQSLRYRWATERVRRRRKTPAKAILGEGLFEESVSFDLLVQLQHSLKDKEYQLIHLGTGYRFKPTILYRRSDKNGVEIPKEVLKGLKFYAEGGGK